MSIALRASTFSLVAEDVCGHQVEITPFADRGQGDVRLSVRVTLPERDGRWQALIFVLDPPDRDVQQLQAGTNPGSGFCDRGAEPDEVELAERIVGVLDDELDLTELRALMCARRAQAALADARDDERRAVAELESAKARVRGAHRDLHRSRQTCQGASADLARLVEQLDVAGL